LSQAVFRGREAATTVAQFVTRRYEAEFRSLASEYLRGSAESAEVDLQNIDKERSKQLKVADKTRKELVRKCGKTRGSAQLQTIDWMHRFVVLDLRSTFDKKKKALAKAQHDLQLKRKAEQEEKARKEELARRLAAEKRDEQLRQMKEARQSYVKQYADKDMQRAQNWILKMLALETDPIEIDFIAEKTSKFPIEAISSTDSKLIVGLEVTLGTVEDARNAAEALGPEKLHWGSSQDWLCGKTAKIAHIDVDAGIARVSITGAVVTLVDQLGLTFMNTLQGGCISSIQVDSTAHKAGLVVGDIVTGVIVGADECRSTQSLTDSQLMTLVYRLPITMKVMQTAVQDHRLAAYLYRQGDLDEALAEFKRVADCKRSCSHDDGEYCYSDIDPGILDRESKIQIDEFCAAANNWFTQGCILSDQGCSTVDSKVSRAKLSLALEAFNRALAIREYVHRAKPFDTSIGLSLASIALTEQQLGNDSTSTKFLERASRIVGLSAGVEDAQLAKCLCFMGDAKLLTLNKVIEREQKLESSRDTAKQIQDLYRKSLSFYRHAVNIYESEDIGGSVEIEVELALTLNIIGVLLEKRDLYEDDDTDLDNDADCWLYFERSRHILERVQPGHNNVATLNTNVAAHHSNRDELEVAQLYFRRAMQIRIHEINPGLPSLLLRFPIVGDFPLEKQRPLQSVISTDLAQLPAAADRYTSIESIPHTCNGGDSARAAWRGVKPNGDTVVVKAIGEGISADSVRDRLRSRGMSHPLIVEPLALIEHAGTVCVEYPFFASSFDRHGDSLDMDAQCSTEPNSLRTGRYKNEQGEWSMYFKPPLKPKEGGVRPARLLDARTKNLILQLTLVLEYLHEHAEVHGNVKPENCLVHDLHGTVSLVDVHVGEFLHSNNDDARVYTAPELTDIRSPWAEFPARLRPAQDMYSLGLILFELMFGTLPDRDPDHEVRWSTYTFVDEMPAYIAPELDKMVEVPIQLRAVEYLLAQPTTDVAKLPGLLQARALGTLVTGLLATAPHQRPAAAELLVSTCFIGGGIRRGGLAVCKAAASAAAVHASALLQRLHARAAHLRLEAEQREDLAQRCAFPYYLCQTVPDCVLKCCLKERSKSA
jgi:tetratricopeptide (TPR) repeat protein